MDEASERQHKVMEVARKTILPDAETRAYGARYIFDLESDTPDELMWNSSERWTLAYVAHAMELSGFNRDTSWDEPSRVLVIIPEQMRDVRMDLMLLVGIGPLVRGSNHAGKGSYGKLFAPSTLTAARWQKLIDRCEQLFGVGDSRVGFTGFVDTWSSLVGGHSVVDSMTVYYFGVVDEDDLNTEDDAIGLTKMLNTERASCVLFHCENARLLGPDILKRSDLHITKVLGGGD